MPMISHRCHPHVRPSLAKGVRPWALVMGLLVGGPALAQRTEPYVPERPDIVLQRVPPATDPRVRQFERLRRDAQAYPGDATRAVALAEAYIDFGRSTGDARYLGRAMAVIEPYLAAPTPPVTALLVQATIQQSRHAFTDARVLLQKITQRDPSSAQAWLTLATVAMVQGDYRAANEACVRLANVGGDFMGLLCTASLRSLDGRARQAYALLTMIEDPGPKAPPAIRAWIESLMAETATRLGDMAGADAHFRQALTWAPGDTFLLADYGEFLLDHGRAKDALALVAADRTSDTSFLIRVAAEKALSLPEARTDIAEMDARFAAMTERGDHVFLREEATYLLNVHYNPGRALALARQNWAVQRAPKDARVYLEAALASNDAAAATEVLAFLQASGMADDTVDPLARQARAAIAATVPSTSTAASRLSARATRP